MQNMEAVQLPSYVVTRCYKLWMVLLSGSTSYGLTTNICKKNVLCCTELCFENDSDNASNRLSDNDDGDS